MSYYWLKKRLQRLKGFRVSDAVQICILIAIAFQAYFLLKQTSAIRQQTSAMEKQLSAMKDHFRIQQRPIVGVSDIRPEVLVDRTLQNEIVPGDELLIHVVFKNIGESPAFIHYLKVKIYCGYFLKNENGSPCFVIHDLCGGGPKEETISLSEELPSENVTFLKDSVLFPNQTTEYTTMTDAKKLMDRIRAYTSSWEAPIIIECEASYTDIDRKEQYWHNCAYELQWPAAKHITIYSMLRKSNAENKSIHLTYGDVMKLVAKRQRIKNVVDTLEKGGNDLNRVINCEGIDKL